MWLNDYFIVCTALFSICGSDMFNRISCSWLNFLTRRMKRSRDIILNQWSLLYTFIFLIALWCIGMCVYSIAQVCVNVCVFLFLCTLIFLLVWVWLQCISGVLIPLCTSKCIICYYYRPKYLPWSIAYGISAGHFSTTLTTSAKVSIMR